VPLPLGLAREHAAAAQAHGRELHGKVRHGARERVKKVFP
jgi:hypothetical protein